MSDENLETQEETSNQNSESNHEDTRDVVSRELDKLDEKSNDLVSEPAIKEPQSKQEEELKGQELKESVDNSPQTEDKKTAEQEEKEPQYKSKNPFYSWKKEAQQELSKLPEKVQQYIIDRESQFHAGLQKYKNEAIIGRQFEQMVSNHREYLEQLQVSPDVAFDKLLSFDKKLRAGNEQQKVEMFRKLAHDYGVNIDEVKNTNFDPRTHQLESRVEDLTRYLERIGNANATAETNHINQTIEQFAQQNEFFEDVRETMADLLDKGFADSLQDAYKKAIRMNDDLFDRYNSKQRESEQMSQIQRADSAAKNAKASAVSVRGAPNGTSRNSSFKSTEDAVRSAMSALGL